YLQAKFALKGYFLRRRQPKWRINHWDMPSEPPGKAEDYSLFEQGEEILAHRFSAGGFDVDFGEKIEWNYFPLKLPNGNPDTEYTVIHSINRFGHLKTVGRLYWYSRDERYAQEFVDQVTDHVQSNPAPEKYIRFTAVWSRLTACSPLNGSWLDAWNHFLPSETFTPEAMTVMLTGFIQKARYAVRAPDAVNRYMAQLTGIYNVGAYFPELKQAEDFRRFGMRGVELAADDEFYPDGLSKELCPGYHGGSRGAIVRIIQSAELMGYAPRPTLEAAMKKSFDVYAAIATPLLGLPQFGDTWGTGDVGRAFQTARGRWDDPVHEWFATAGNQGSPPKFTSTRLPWSGFYTMRSGWDKRGLYLCFDAGPVGLGHFHEDFSNFECYAFGERLISDVGVNSYTVNKWHNYCYSSLAHNVVIVDGLSQARAAFPAEHPRVVERPRASDWHSDSVFDLAFGVLDAPWVAYSDWVGPSNRFGRASAVELATCRRDICFVKDSYWIISDRLTAEGEHSYEQLFHLRPDRTAKVLGKRTAGTSNGARPNVVLIQADDVPAEIIVGREEPPQGWVAVGHGEMEPAPCISFRQRATGGAIYDTVVLPLDVGRKADADLTRLRVNDQAGDDVPASDVCALRIVTAAGTDYYLNDLRQEQIGPANGRLKIAGPLESDARTALVRLARDGALLKASAVGASFIKLNGQTIWRPQVARSNR
ncbi:MAG: alginate lyase family protein, partial [Planctomycetes bacterium]|nr:alginate lyase family protein [Planctomycetota bacterium]